MLAEDKSIRLGHPSYVWRFGQERRLSLIRRFLPLEGKRILDIGCGIGTYLRQFSRFTPATYGIDIDPQRVAAARAQGLFNTLVAVSEQLPFRTEAFDVVFLNEVIEHVASDRQTIEEAHRVTRPGGALVVYAPNRLYPFETHGFYLGKRYIFKLLPFVNYLPHRLRRFFVPHVRAYQGRELQALFAGLPVTKVVHTYVYPGFDGIASRSRPLAGLLRKVLYFLEKTPLRIFGLSHFLVLRKTS